MASDSDRNTKPRDLQLSRKNWQRWFDDLELYFESKGIEMAIQKTLVEYARTAPILPPPIPNTTAKDLPDILNKLSLGASVDNNRESQRQILNVEKEKEYRLASAKCKLKINRGLSDEDRDFVRVHDDAKTRWDTLKAKYSRTTALDTQHLLQRITSFQYGKDKDGKDIDMNIDSAWSILREARRRVRAADPGMAMTFGETQLFGFLLNGLPPKFAVAKQSLLVQPNLEIYEKIDLLRTVEQDLEGHSESANAALWGNDKPEKRKERGTSPRAHRGCYFCDGAHNITDCEVRRQLIDMVASFNVKKQSKQKSRSKLPSSRRRPQPPRKGKGKGYSARTSADTSDDDSGSSEPESTSDDSDDDHDEDAHVSKADLRKIPESDWCSDTGCTAHMTDKPHLFRGPLTKIKRRSIKVGGGRLYADSMGTVEMNVAGVSFLLQNVLLVPGLGINLLSSRKICAELNCVGVFNNQFMWFINNDHKVIFKAKIKDGLYVVSKVTSQKLTPGPDPRVNSFKESALSALTQLSEDRENGCTPEPGSRVNLAEMTPGPGPRVDSANSPTTTLGPGSQVKFAEMTPGPGPRVKFANSSETTPEPGPRVDLAISGKSTPEPGPRVDLAVSPKTTPEPGSQLENGKTSNCCHQSFPAADDEVSTDDGLPKLSEAESLSRYQLMHRRFAHLGPEKLRGLHKVSTLKRKIQVPKDRPVCRICKLTKLRNRTRTELSPWKDSILALISIDTAGPFTTSIRGNNWFSQIVDNSTRQTWTICARTKSELMEKLETWKVTEERRTQLKLMAVRSDNASEIRAKLDEWAKQGVRYEPTVTYEGSHQNGIAERSIQQAETDCRALLRDADLPLEFWDLAVEADAYLRNRTGSGPIVNGTRISPYEAYFGQKPSLDHIRVFGSVCYSYISPKSWPAGIKSKKLMDRGRECVFVGYVEQTTKQWMVYAPDLGRVITSSVVEFDESRNGGSCP
ncbi:hypothetical protein PZA11_002196 [Diplocarpon coronariae]